MAGRPRQKVFCQTLTRKSLREGKPRFCLAKGYYLANGTYKCRFHGYNNVLGFNKPNYTDDKRINQLSSLYQLRNKTREQVREYYYREIKGRIGTNQKSRYYHKQSYRRKDTFRMYKGQESKPLTNILDEILCDLKKKYRT